MLRESERDRRDDDDHGRRRWSRAGLTLAAALLAAR